MAAAIGMMSSATPPPSSAAISTVRNPIRSPSAPPSGEMSAPTRAAVPATRRDRRGEARPDPDDPLDEDRDVRARHLGRQERQAEDREDPTDRRIGQDALDGPERERQDRPSGTTVGPDLLRPERHEQGGPDGQQGGDGEHRRERPAEAVHDDAAEDRPDGEPDRPGRAEDRDRHAEARERRRRPGCPASITPVFPSWNPISSIARASCHGSRASGHSPKTTASTRALRTMTALRLYLSAQTPHSGTSGAPTMKIRELNRPTNASRSAGGDAHLAQVDRDEREDLADAQSLDHRHGPEHRHEDAPVLGGSRGRSGTRSEGSRSRVRGSGSRRAARTKAPEGTVGAQPFGGFGGFDKSQSLIAAGSLAHLPCGRRTRFPGPFRGSLPGAVWWFALPLRARRNVRPGALSPQRPYPRSCDAGREVIPEVVGDVDGLWILSAEEAPMAHWLARLVAWQDRWATPLGDFNHRWLSALFRPIRPSRTCSTGRGWATRSMPPSRTCRSGRSSRPSSSTCWATARRPTWRSPLTVAFMLAVGDHRRRRLRRHGWHRPVPGHPPLDADGRGARAAARLARPGAGGRRSVGRRRPVDRGAAPRRGRRLRRR